jgi:dCTP deaminase
VFLSDQELHAQLQETSDLFKGLDDTVLPYKSGSPVQAASVDLRIGGIFVPGSNPAMLGSAAKPRTQMTLAPGETAVVETLERCNLPKTIGAIGFPPASVSSKGVLMTNPGHIDPGYEGTLSFTVINMAEEGYELRRKDVIVTLLLFKLDTPAQAGYVDRFGPTGPAVSDQLLKRLSPDFLSVKKRVKAAATAEENKTRRISLGVPILVGLIGIITAWSATWLTSSNDINDLKRQTAVLQQQVNDQKTQQQLDQVSKQMGLVVERVALLERARR